MSILDWILRRSQRDNAWSNQSRRFYKALRYMEKQREFNFDVFVKCHEITSGGSKTREELQKDWDQMLRHCSVFERNPRDFHKEVLTRGIKFSVYASNREGGI